MALHMINLKEKAPEMVNVSFQTEKVLFYYKNIYYCKSAFNINGQKHRSVCSGFINLFNSIVQITNAE